MFINDDNPELYKKAIWYEIVIYVEIEDCEKQRVEMKL